MKSRNQTIRNIFDATMPILLLCFCFTLVMTFLANSLTALYVCAGSIVGMLAVFIWKEYKLGAI